jgi:hypothetical protein
MGILYCRLQNYCFSFSEFCVACFYFAFRFVVFLLEISQWKSLGYSCEGLII